MGDGARGGALRWGGLLLLLVCAPVMEARGVWPRWLTPRQASALTAAGFLRDSVESVPAHEVPSDGERGAHRSALRAPVFGSRPLPLRSAVEKVPNSRDRAQVRFPLRDAVERRPAPEVVPSRPAMPHPRPLAVARPTVPTGWLHSINVANPFLAAAGLGWWNQRTNAVLGQQAFGSVPSPAFLYHVQHPARHPQDTGLGGIPVFRSAEVLRLQPQQRWGIISSPNYVFNNVLNGHSKPSSNLEQAPPIITYVAKENVHPKVVCYFEAWAAYRKDVVAYSANNVDPFACTHLIYAFAAIDPHTFRMEPQDEEYDLIKGGYRSAVGLKRKNPALKVLLSVGGWMEGSSKFSQMASQANRRREFIRSVVRLLETHKFDGLDLDWEYPGALDLGGLPTDKGHFSLLVEELSEVFKPRGWLLTAAVSPSRFRIEDAYDIPRISQNLDLIHLMSFDLHAERDSSADHHAPLTARPHDTSIDIFYNVDYAVKYWIKRGAPAEKLILGVPFYGRSFTLKDPNQITPGSAIKGLGHEGKYTQEKGFLSYFEICELQAEGGWRLSSDRAGSPFMVKDDQWVGYEDARSIANKVAYIRRQGLGGVMVWAVDLDDFQGICGEKTPLLNAVRSHIYGEPMSDEPLPPNVRPIGAPAPLLTTGKPGATVPEEATPSPTRSTSSNPQTTPTPTAVPGLAVSVDKDSDVCNGTGFVKDPVDCNVYHRCDFNRKTTYVCPEPLHFSVKRNLCDWPENAGCSTHPDGTKHAHGVDDHVSKACTLRNGVVGDPDDCSRYYWCSGGRAHHLRCSRGQYFHAVSGLCLYGSPRDICQDDLNSVETVLQKVRWEGKNDDLIGEENFKVACYFTSWASYRKGDGKFVPEHMDPRLCTHIVYAFASLEPETLTIQPFDNWADIEHNFYDRLTALPDPRQGRDDQLKVLLSMGGWTDSTGDKYSKLVSSGTNRRKFVSSAVAFLRRHNFRGLQLDWNYPKCWQSDCRKGPESDKPNFTKFIRELYEAFSKESPPLVLAVGISGYKEIIDNAYELDEISKYVEYISVMSYDYHGNWERKTGHVSPLYYRQGDANPYYNTNATMEYIVKKGAQRNKLLVGLPFYGQSFELKSKETTALGSPTDGPGEAGEFTLQPGMLAYYEICDRIRKKEWTVGKDPQGATGPYAFSGDQWVSYEDVDSIKAKARFVKNMGYGGAVAWTVDLDDFGNRCCLEPFPLLRTVNRVLGRLSEDAPTTGDCTKPPTPVTPTPPVLTTGVDTGDNGDGSWRPPSTSTSWPSWSEPDVTTPSTTTTTWPSWKPPSTTSTTTTRAPSTSTTSTTTTKPPTTTSATSTTAVPTTITTPPPTITSPMPPEGTSPVDAAESCESGEYKPDPSNCNAYYRCILGELKKQYCAGGLHWNKDTKVCDWPSESSCPSQGSDSSQSTTAPTSASTSTSSSTSTRDPDEWWTHSTTERPNEWWTHSTTTTESTTKMTTEKPSTTTTSTSTTAKTTTTERTAEETTPPTKPGETTDASCNNGQYYPSKTACDEFYICVNGRLVQQHCANGLVWNQESNMCDWKFNVKCSADLVLRGGEEQCQMGEYRSHPDCTHYYMCVHGELVSFPCASGLQWNKEKQICDWPSNAQCEGGSIPVDSGSAEETTPSSVRPTPPAWKPPTTTSTTPAPDIPEEPLPHLSGYFKIVCYFTNWAWYRQGLGKYLPEDINGDLCTHIVYGFAVLDYENLVVKAHDSWADFDNKFYERVVAYKKKGKKVSLALGGWNDSAGDKYSRLVNNPAARRRFIKHVLEFLDRYDFDGLDLDWEYPKCWQVNCEKGPDSDKAAFGAFVRELREAFDAKGLLLSSAVSPSKTVIDAGYDVPALAASLDWVAVMTYDFHGQWDKKTGHVAPMYFHPDDDFHFFNANYSINYWIQEGVPRRKIVMGMPLYGQSFQLAEASTNGLNARAPGPGQAGEFTRAAGFLAYYEICDRVKNRGWTVVQDEKKRMGPYAFHGNQWVSYDDKEMIRLKSQYIRDNNLGGGMIWALDLDDFRNRCGEGRSPLLKTIRRILGPALGDEGSTYPQTSEKPQITEEPESAEKPESSNGETAAKPSESSPVVAETDRPPVELAPEKPIIDTTETATVDYGSPRPPKPTDSEFKVVCYFTNWAWYRQGLGKYLPSDIDPSLCTHVVYGFAVLDGDQLVIKPHDTWADYDNKFYEKVTALKSKGIKVLIAIGGWNDSAGDKYSRLVNNPSARARFVTKVIEFIEKNDFDGLDLDWEYPKCWQVNCKAGPDSDKQGFAALVRELREAFNPKGLMLTSAVSPNKAVIDAGYDVPTLSRDLDWIAVMTYDYHGQWDKKTGHVAPMYVHPSDVDATFNANFTIHYWLSQGADPKKIVMGMPMYGQSFSLAETTNHGLNAPTYGGGEAGDFTRARGFLSYYEICYYIQQKGWKVVQDPTGAMGPYAYLRDQWVSYDDLNMIRYKSEWIKKMGLGGGMIWALDLDDFTNRCHCETYPLLKTINRVLRGYDRSPDPKCVLVTDSNRGEEDNNNAIDEQGPDSSGSTGTEEAGVIVVTAGLSTGTECKGEAFQPHESDCNMYYTCQFDQLVPQACPAGLYWNKDHCDWPENSKCTSSSSPDKIPTMTETALSTSDVATPPPPTPPRPTTTPRPTSPGTDVDYKPPKPADKDGYKVVCYFTNWAWYRQGMGKYTPEDIDADLCTHITYGFAVLDGSTLTIKPHDSWADLDNDFYRKVVEYKKKGIRVSIAIGGWNDSLGDKYSRLVNDPRARARFVADVVKFIEKYGFEGLDLDWEYPKCWQVNCNLGPESDKEGFASLVRELSAEFKPRGWLLSSAVSPSKLVIDEGYDVPTLSEHFDWIAVMTYDFHGHWDKHTGHVAPLYYVPGDTYDYFNANFTMHYWIEKGADPKKLIMGMPMYGQSFALADTNENGLNAKSYGPGEAGEFTRAGGFLAYYEICDYVKRRGWTVVRDPEGRIGPYAHRGNQWVSYDDVDDIRRKSKFIKEMGLAGGMIWALDLDDFQNRCGCGVHPLLKTINQELRGLPFSGVNCT